jgi:uncharacterized protein (TIGR03000 family)
MYSIVLAMALAPGNAAPADIDSDIRELRRSIAELRQEQAQTEIDELKQVVNSLQRRVTDDKLDEIRRDLFLMQREREMLHMHSVHSRAFYMPMADHNIHRATVAVEIPAGAAFAVNNQDIYVPPTEPVFVTPPLEPGRDYFYDCKVTVTRDGKSVTKTKRVRVHAGELVRINYNDMDSREQREPKEGP